MHSGGAKKHQRFVWIRITHAVRRATCSGVRCKPPVNCGGIGESSTRPLIRDFGSVERRSRRTGPSGSAPTPKFPREGTSQRTVPTGPETKPRDRIPDASHRSSHRLEHESAACDRAAKANPARCAAKASRSPSLLFRTQSASWIGQHSVFALLVIRASGYSSGTPLGVRSPSCRNLHSASRSADGSPHPPNSRRSSSSTHATLRSEDRRHS